MKEIEKSKIKDAIKLLKKIPYRPTEKSKSVFFFPIKTTDSAEITSEKIVFLEKNNFGSNSFIIPGLILGQDKDENTECFFGYASVEYSKEFLIKNYLEIVDMKRRDIEKICELKCLLVRNEYVLSEYKISKSKK